MCGNAAELGPEDEVRLRIDPRGGGGGEGHGAGLIHSLASLEHYLPDDRGLWNSPHQKLHVLVFKLFRKKKKSFKNLCIFFFPSLNQSPFLDKLQSSVLLIR